MRILILNNLFPPYILGGYEIACRSVAVALRARGHIVEVLTGHAPMATPDDPAWLHRVLTLRAYDPIEPQSAEAAAVKLYEAGCSQYANTTTLLAHLRRFQPDVVYTWHLWGLGGLALLDVLEGLEIPWLMHLMDTVPALLYMHTASAAASLFTRTDAALLRGAQVISMSQHILDEIDRISGIRFDTTPVIVPGWVDADGLPQRQTYLEDGLLKLVAVGTVHINKGTDIIIEACARLVEAGHTAFHVDFYGPGDATQWLALAARLGVAGHIAFHGARPQQEVLALLARYDALVFPTWEIEPFGFVAVEAAACGVVPIMTRNAGAAERLVDEVHALKIERTPDALAQAIIRILTGDVDVARLGRRAARLVRRDLRFDRCLDEIERVLQAVARPWQGSGLDDPRLIATLFAKHALGHHLTLHR